MSFQFGSVQLRSVRAFTGVYCSSGRHA